MYPLGRDSTLVPQIANVSNWSKHRFRQRLWSVCMRQNQNDFHQFSWSPADFLFSTLNSWFYCCQQSANLADIQFHSLWQAPTIQRLKNPKDFFHWSTSNWSDAHFSIIKNHSTYQNFCSLLQITFCFVNLAWSKSQYVYDRPTHLHTRSHFKKFGPA